MKAAFLLLVLAIGVQGCTERLTTPGGCPALCPGGTPVIRDTVIDAVFGLDSSFSGYTSMVEPTSLPISDGGAVGESRAVIRFLRRGDSVTVADTAYEVVVDSVILQFGLQDRNPAAEGLKLEVYRLDSSVDSMITWQELTSQMVPERLLGSAAIGDDVENGPIRLRFTGDEVAKFDFAPADSTRLVIGLRVTATTGNAAAYFGATRAGEAGPFFQSWITLPVADTARQHQMVQRSPAQNFTLQPEPTSVGPDQLLIGGRPASRALIRFDLPPYLRDSASIVRATLELTPVAPLVGIPGDSTRLEASALLADFGAKSVIFPGASGNTATWIHTGDSQISFEVTRLVRLWQGTEGLPDVLRVRNSFEWSSFLEPVILSTRSASPGAARIRITYQPPFAVEGF